MLQETVQQLRSKKIEKQIKKKGTLDQKGRIPPCGRRTFLNNCDLPSVVAEGGGRRRND